MLYINPEFFFVRQDLQYSCTSGAHGSTEGEDAGDHMGSEY